VIKLDKIFKGSLGRDEKKEDPYREYIMKHAFTDDIECLIMVESGKLFIYRCMLNLAFIS